MQPGSMLDGYNWRGYYNAVQDARRLKEKRPLVPLVFNAQGQSQHLLHWSSKPWTGKIQGPRVIKSDEVWAFPVAEVKTKLAGFRGDPAQIELRLKKLLGLPPW